MSAPIALKATCSDPASSPPSLSRNDGWRGAVVMRKIKSRGCNALTSRPITVIPTNKVCISHPWLDARQRSLDSALRATPSRRFGE